MLEKTVKVKRPPPLKRASVAELVTSRHDAATSNSIASGNLRFLEQREQQRSEFLKQQQVLATPQLLPQPGRAAYSNRVISCLERELRQADAAAGGAPATPVAASAEPLGNNTESHAAFTEAIDENTGEIQRLRRVSKRGETVLETFSDFSSINARAARFAAQTSAGKLLAKEVTPRGGQWRVSGCIRRKVAAEVSILYTPAMKKAHFGGLMVCGSVWTCPPCAAKVSERRKNEVVSATDRHKGAGGGLYLVTFTTSHKRHDDLGEWLGKFSVAKIKMRGYRAYIALRAEMGYVGDIRALEVTYGDDNGWHPHEHGLWLTDRPLTARQIERMTSVLFKLWHRACGAAGLPLPNRKRGVDVRFMESSAEYVAKFGREPRWGAGSELAKQHIKSGKVKSMTPFDLLRRYHEGSDDGSHKRFGGLFVQFAKCFFGKRQVVWSDGLKELFGIEQKTDEEISVEESEDARELVRISGEQWRCVLHQKSDVRQILLTLAETGGHDAVVSYIKSLMHRNDVMLS